MSFPPLNLYTFAAARGQFLRPDVQALLKSASVGLYFDFANSHAPVLRREAAALRKQLDALLFGEPSRPARTERPLAAGADLEIDWNSKARNGVSKPWPTPSVRLVT